MEGGGVGGTGCPAHPILAIIIRQQARLGLEHPALSSFGLESAPENHEPFTLLEGLPSYGAESMADAKEYLPIPLAFLIHFEQLANSFLNSILCWQTHRSPFPQRSTHFLPIFNGSCQLCLN